MKIVITKTNGKWLINGKPYNQTSKKEQDFFNEFILAMKWQNGCEKHDKKILKAS